METTKNRREEDTRRTRQSGTDAPRQRPQNRRSQDEPGRKAPPAKKAKPAAGARSGENRAKSGGEPAKQRRTRPAPEPSETAERKQTAAKTGQRPRPAQTPRKGAGEAPAKKSRAAGKAAPRRQEPPTDLSQNSAGKRRAYGNSKPKKKSTFEILRDAVRDTVQNNAIKKAQKAADPVTKRQRAQKAAPAVIYTRPQAFNRNRLLIQLATVTAVVAAMVLGLSVFFKVETITVSGAEAYDPWSIREASGIQEGDNLLTFSRTRASAMIKAKLPYVKDVSFGIKLPDTVNIIVAEEDVVYAIQDQNEQWWLMNSEGGIVEQSNAAKASNYTKILGVTLDSPSEGGEAVAVEAVSAAVAATVATDETGTATEATVPVTVTGAQRLNAALEILQALEANDIVGEAASVDVSQLEQITLWYGTRYQVSLGDTTRLDYKISCMSDVILQLSDYQSGMLDLSFTIRTDQVVYTPFS